MDSNNPTGSQPMGQEETKVAAPGFFDRLRGIKTGEEKELVESVKELMRQEKYEDAIGKCEAFLKDHADSGIAKTYLDKAKDENVRVKATLQAQDKPGESVKEKEPPPEKAPDNIYTKLFQKGEKEKGSMIETIVGQADEQKEAEVAEKVKKEKARKGLISSIFKRAPIKAKAGKPLREQLGWEYGVFVFSLVMVILGSLFFYSELDSENKILSLLGIENPGLKNVRLTEEITSLKREIKNAETTLNRLKSSEIRKRHTEVLAEIKKQRISWSDILKSIEEVTNRLSPSYFEDIEYKAFALDSAKRVVAITAGVKNEKVFTLIADLIDEFEQSEFFENVSFSKFSKNEIKDSREFQSNIRLQFQYVPMLNEDDQGAKIAEKK